MDLLIENTIIRIDLGEPLGIIYGETQNFYLHKNYYQLLGVTR